PSLLVIIPLPNPSFLPLSRSHSIIPLSLPFSHPSHFSPTHTHTHTHIQCSFIVPWSLQRRPFERSAMMSRDTAQTRLSDHEGKMFQNIKRDRKSTRLNSR